MDASAPAGVERAPSASAPSVAAPLPSADPADIPLPDNADEALFEESMFLACEDSGISVCKEDSLMHITTLLPGVDENTPPLAEDGYPYITQPLECGEQQAYCLEIPIKDKDLKRWQSEKSPVQMIAIAAAGKRARAEVSLKDLTPAEMRLFDTAKQKEIQCWLQTSAIRKILRNRSNPNQILRSRWVLTWKPPEPGSSQQRAKARLVVLGFQDPKLTEVMRVPLLWAEKGDPWYSKP